MPRTSPKRRRLVKVLAGVFSVCMAFVVSEVALRVLTVFEIGPAVAAVERARKYQVDPHLGWKLRADFQGRVRCPEFTMHVRTDEDGFRIPLSGTDSQPSPLRILAVGDSFTMGYGVEYEETFIVQLKHCLNQSRPAGRAVDVINGGVPGYSFREDDLFLQAHFDTISPDLVVLGVTINDHTDAVLEHPKYQPKSGFLRENPDNYPERQQAVKESPALPASLIDRGIVAVYRRSLVVRTVHQGIKSLASRKQGGTVPDFDTDRKAGKDAWEKSIKYLDAIHSRLKEQQVPLVVMRIPHRSTVHPGSPHDAHIRRGLFVDTRDWLASYCREKGIAYVDPIPELQIAASKGEYTYYRKYDAHWNPVGHRIAAESLVPTVLESLESE